MRDMIFALCCVGLVAACDAPAVTPEAAGPSAPPEVQAQARTDNASPAVETEAIEAQSAFSWTASFDPSGYYLPNTGFELDGWVIEMLFLGSQWEFEAWQTDQSGWSGVPVFFEIRPEDAQPLTNEMGGTYYAESLRVHADQFVLSDTAFEFSGATPSGPLTFLGQIEPDLLQGEATTPQDGQAALSGVLTVGNETAPVTSFMHWHGD